MLLLPSLSCSSSSSLYSKFDTVPALKQPLVGGVVDMQLRVPLAGFIAATSRTVIECPIEYAKVKGQTGQKWALREIYQGGMYQWGRTGPMMTIYFCLVDTARRNGLMTTLPGQVSLFNTLLK